MQVPRILKFIFFQMNYAEDVFRFLLNQHFNFEDIAEYDIIFYSEDMSPSEFQNEYW